MDPVGVGTVLAGKYRIEALIGRGGMGSVWRAHHLGLSAPVAVKLLDFVGVGSSDAMARFHREAKAAAAIRSPHVVQILDHGVDPTHEVPFIVMELMEGESLARRLGQRCLSPAETATVMTHVARALSRAHDAGIVHRDLKPDNVFLVRNEDEEVAKVLDFGIAKAHPNAVGGTSGTRTGTVMGTVYYMSPEQISGAKHVDFRTDLWAFGVIAYECLTGARPFDGDTIGGLTLKICVEPMPVPSQHATVPNGFDAWFARAVNRDLGQRFPSARDAAEALRAICTAKTDVAQRPGATLPITSPAYGVVAAQSAHAASTAAPTSREADLVPKQRSALPWLLVGSAALIVAGGTAVALRSPAEEASRAAEPPASTQVLTTAAVASSAPTLAVLPMAEAPATSPSAQPDAAVVTSVAPAAPAKSPAKSALPKRTAAPKSAAPHASPAVAAASAVTAKAATPAATGAKPARDLIDSRH